MSGRPRTSTRPSGPHPTGADLALGAALAATGPLLRLGHFALANRHTTADPATVVGVAVPSAVVLAALAVVTSRALRRPPVAVGAMFATAGFFFYGASAFGGSLAVRLGLWAVVSVLSGIGLASALRSHRVAVAVTASLAVVASALTLHATFAGRPSLARSGPHQPVEPGRPLDPLPNIYLFVADALARHDVLAAMGHDDSAFRATMSDAGLVTDPDATTAYPSTELSVPALLEQAYLVGDGDDAPTGASTRALMAGDNATVRQLRDLGYRYLDITTGLSDMLACDPDLADACITPATEGHTIDLGETARAIVELTPFGPLSRSSLAPQDSAATPRSALAGLEALGDDLPEPFFFKAHVLLPHPPYRLAADCSPLPTVVGSLAEGWTPDMVEPYLAQVRCVHDQLADVVTTVVRDDPDAIVIVISDHGPAFRAPVSRPVGEWTVEDVTERFGIERSMRLPEGCGSDDGAAASSVNTFRIVVACITGTEPDLLAPRAYLTPPWGTDEVEPLPDPVLAPL